MAGSACRAGGDNLINRARDDGVAMRANGNKTAARFPNRGGKVRISAAVKVAPGGRRIMVIP